MADRVQQRRDTKARWAQFNPILLEGEIGYVTDEPNLYKIGDGVNAWNALPFRGFNGTILEDVGQSKDSVMSQNVITECLLNVGFVHGGIANVRKSNLIEGVPTFEGVVYKDGSGIEPIQTFFKHTDYIDIEGISLLFMSSIPQQGACFYTADKNYISGVGFDFGHFVLNAFIKVPQGAKYIRANFEKTSLAEGTAYLVAGETLDANLKIYYPWLVSEDKRFEDIPLYTRSFEYEDGILKDGIVSLSYPQFKTYKFDVTSQRGKTLSISASGLADSNCDWDLYVFETDAGIQTIVKNNIGETLTDYNVKVPQDAKYLKMSVTKTVFIYTDANVLLLPNILSTKQLGEQLGEQLGKQLGKIPPTGTSVIMKDDDVNLLSSTAFTEGKCLDQSNGNEVTIENYSYTDYIDVTNIKKLQIHFVPENGGCFYDSEKNFIGGFRCETGLVSEPNKIIDVPKRAIYVRVNVNINNRNEKTAYVIDYAKSPRDVTFPWLITEVKNALVKTGERKGYMAYNGTINTSISSGGTISQYDLNGVKEVFVTSTTGLGGANPQWCTIWVVNASGTPILMLPVDITTNTLNNYRVVIPDGGTQIWVQNPNPAVMIISNLDDAITEINNKIDNIAATRQENQWTGKKIVWLGTSIPYGQGAAGTGQAPTTYPMQVGKNLGAIMTNVAQPGMAIETTDDFKVKTFGSLSLTIAELQNQGAATTPFNSFENAMLGKDADLYVFDCEPNNSAWSLVDLENFNVQGWKYNDGSAFESHRNTYVGAFLFLLDKLWSEKPSAKVVMVSEFISGADLDSKYQGTETSRAIAEKLRIPFIDVAKKLYYTPLNKSLYLNSDNVHPTQATHDRIAAMLSHEFLLIG